MALEWLWGVCERRRIGAILDAERLSWYASAVRRRRAQEPLSGVLGHPVFVHMARRWERRTGADVGALTLLRARRLVVGPAPAHTRPHCTVMFRPMCPRRVGKSSFRNESPGCRPMSSSSGQHRSASPRLAHSPGMLCDVGGLLEAAHDRENMVTRKLPKHCSTRIP